MKYIHTNLYRLAMLALAVWLAACDNDENPGAPHIDNVRLTTTEGSLDSATLGDYLVIQGRNLGTTREVYFNSVQANVRTTFITDDNIVIDVPNTAPKEVTNAVRVITDGGEASYSLVIKVPAPIVKNFSNEFAKPGDIITISGDYFYSVQKVLFPNNIEADILETLEPNAVKVRVPEDALAGRVSVVSLFGTGTSAISYMDTQGIFMDFDALPKCWGGMQEKDASADKVPEPIMGKFGYSYKTVIPAQFWWDDALVLAHCGPYAIEGDVSQYALKFEINTSEPWIYGWYEINFSWSHFYRFNPWKGDTKEEDKPFTTKGEWITVTIPLNEFRTKDEAGKPAGDRLNAAAVVKDLVMAFQNEGPEEVAVLNVSFDNFRIVKVE